MVWSITTIITDFGTKFWSQALPHGIVDIFAAESNKETSDGEKYDYISSKNVQAGGSSYL